MLDKIKNIGLTDKYFIITSILIGIFCFSCLVIFTFTDNDPIAYFGGAIGLLGTIAGFVINKTKKENTSKIENWGNPENCNKS